jgi:hypothetical protein
MADEDTTNPVDGGEPTDAEAKLAAQVTTIGDNPSEEPAEDVTPPAAAPAADTTVPAEPADTPAAAPAPAPEPAAPAPAVPPPSAPAKPEPPKDFSAAFDDLQKRYDDGDIDSTEYANATRELSREEAGYTARVTIWEENQRTAAQQAANSFNEAAFAWESANKEFMANPLRRKQMQEAVDHFAAAEPGLSNEQLLTKAANAAFEAFNWQPVAPAAANAPNQATAIAAATAARAPKPVPATLANAPAAAVTQGGGNAVFDELDGKSIGDLEDAMARMTPAQREDYLRAAPGSTSTGHETP